MIGWFQNKKRKKQIGTLENILVDKLSISFPNMVDIYKNSKLLSSFSIITPRPFIQLQHSINEPYYAKNKKKHSTYYILKGIEIKKKDSTGFVEIPIEVTWDLISRIEIDHPHDFWNHYDIDCIRIDNLVRSDIQIRNEDEEKLKEILKTLQPDQIKKLEIDDTFEIDMDGKKFYTILDMEDGNYIAVNTTGDVYRLNHDSNERVKLIHKSIHGFLDKFSGDKKELEKYFDS